MKKRLIATILMILIYMILASCNSCIRSSAQSAKGEVPQYVDSLINTPKDTDVSASFNQQDTDEKKLIIKKEIKKMEIDTNNKWKLKRDSIFKELEKTEKQLKDQNKIIDSIIVIKKK